MTRSERIMQIDIAVTHIEKQLHGLAEWERRYGSSDYDREIDLELKVLALEDERDQLMH